MAGVLVGYARVSTCDQQAGLDAQVRDLKAAGCEEIFSEQVSAVAQRDRLKEALRFVRRGDTAVVTRPDRLARSNTDLLRIVHDLDRRGVGLIMLSMRGQTIDTRSRTGIARGYCRIRKRASAGETTRRGIKGQNGGQVQGPEADGAGQSRRGDQARSPRVTAN
jgi:DNA invertase Pin-like site-specific DNA recombinase